MKQLKGWRKYGWDLKGYWLQKGLHMSLVLHPKLQKIKQNLDLELWQRHGLLNFRDIVKEGQLVSLEFIRSKIQRVNWFQYTQIKSVVNELLRTNLIRKDLTKLEILLQSGAVFKRTLSKMYAVLWQNKGLAGISRIRWGKDLQREIPYAEWHYTHVLIRTISINSAIREKFYKLRQR